MNVKSLPKDTIVRRNEDGTFTAYQEGIKIPGLGMALYAQRVTAIYVPPVWLPEVTIEKGNILYLPTEEEMSWFSTGPGKSLNWAVEIEDGKEPPKGVTVREENSIALGMLKKYKTWEKILESSTYDYQTLSHIDKIYGDGRLAHRFNKINADHKDNRIYGTKTLPFLYPTWKPLTGIDLNSVPQWVEIQKHYVNHKTPEVIQAFQDALEAVCKSKKAIEYDTYRKIILILEILNQKTRGKPKLCPFETPIPKEWKAKLFHIIQEREDASIQTLLTCYCVEQHIKSMLEEEDPNRSIANSNKKRLERLNDPSMTFEREDAAKIWNNPEISVDTIVYGNNGCPREINIPQGKQTLLENTPRTDKIVEALLKEKHVNDIAKLADKNIFPPKHLIQIIKFLGEGENLKNPEIKKTRETLIQKIS